jgi:iron complex transport system ATP-binding protein
LHHKVDAPPAARSRAILGPMSPPPTHSALLQFHDIHFSRGEKTILNNISWQVARSEIAAIIGPNGCGKSTLLRIASGYLWPQRGTVQLLGETFGQVPIAPIRARIGIVEATTVYPFDETMTAREVVVSGYYSALTLGYVHPERQHFEHADHLLQQVGLAAHAEQLYVTLSTGERLRTLLARALVRKPDLLLLDEPTAGLDLPARESILATLTRLHRASQAPPAMITITHHLEELLPDTANILLLSPTGSVVASGKPESILTDENLSRTFGVPVHISQQHGRYHATVNPTAWNELL